MTQLQKHLFATSTLPVLLKPLFKDLGLRIIPINCLFNSHILVHRLMVLSVNAGVVWGHCAPPRQRQQIGILPGKGIPERR